MQNIIVIVGPTGVGKTKLSIELAKRFDAEIINGDSVSIYKKLDIGSAKPSREEMDGVVHHLINICDVNDTYSVYDYQKDVRNIINDISSRGKRIIIVGGTGLYIKSALYDYRFNEEKNISNYENLTNEELICQIKQYTNEKIPHINNRRRLVRLLNKLSNNEEIEYNKDKVLYPITVIGLTTDRNILYNRINNRVDLMIKNGLVNEVLSLKKSYLSSRVLNSAIGYKEFNDYLFNNKSLDEVIEEIKLNSRRYAKRQYTFFRNQFDTKWIDVDFSNFNNTIEDVVKSIEK